MKTYQVYSAGKRAWHRLVSAHHRPPRTPLAGRHDVAEVWNGLDQAVAVVGVGHGSGSGLDIVVWAVKPTSLLRLRHDGLVAFTAQHMAVANDLLFASGRVLAMRVRLATVRSERLAFSQGG